MELPLNQIVQGDCLEVLRGFPDKSIDLVLTDPPYGIGIGASVGGGKPFGDGKSSGQKSIIPKSYRGFDDTRIPSKEVFQEMMRVSKNQIIFGGNYFIEYLTNSPCWIVWDKDNSGNFADCELVWTSFKTAVRKIEFRWNGMLQEDMKHKEERYHPTQKPIEVMRWIIEKYSEAGQIILDPFIGSGSTAIAAKMSDRNFIGIEISEYYVKVARERLKSVTPKLL